MVEILVMLLLLSLATMSSQTNAKWNHCSHGGWLPYREDGLADVNSSFYACIEQTPVALDWETSHFTCTVRNTMMASWTHWKQLAFFYHAFQKFEQTLDSDPHFLVALNLRDDPFPSYTSYYRDYSNGNRGHRRTWNSNRDTMIPVKHRWYPQSQDELRDDINCAAIQMESSTFTDSSIYFIPCTGSPSLQQHAEYNVKSVLCQKERQKCPTVVDETLGANVVRIEGIYEYYYGTMHNRAQIPNPALLVNVSHCLVGCNSNTTLSVNFFSGDLLRYWCEVGHRADPAQHSWNANYARCSEEGSWQYKPCESRPCSGIECQNGGVGYNSEGCICDCTDGWTGTTCGARNYNYHCDSLPCLNGGTCRHSNNQSGGYQCECKGAVGLNCEYELNECSSNPCANGSLCVDQLDGYICICDSLTRGRHCTEAVPFCERINEPCKNGAKCYSCNLEVFMGWCETENETQYICECRQGFAGPDCSVELRPMSDAGEIVSAVFGCMAFVIIALMCEIIGSKRRHDHENLQVLLDDIDGYIKEQLNIRKLKKTRSGKKSSLTAAPPQMTSPTDVTTEFTLQSQSNDKRSQSKTKGRSRYSMSSQSSNKDYSRHSINSKSKYRIKRRSSSRSRRRSGHSSSSTSTATKDSNMD